MLVSERRKNKGNNKPITVNLKFKDGTSFGVACKQTLQTIFCPMCNFENKNLYKISKHLKGHFKRGERKELFINQQKMNE